MSKKPRYINRELSWLEFNQRVLDESCDDSLPLLERLKFIAITASNLDEFFSVRVGGLQDLAREDSTRLDPSGMTPAAQLAAISERTRKMTEQQYCCLDVLERGLAKAGIRRVHKGQLTVPQSELLQQVVEEEIFPVLTPMAVDLERPFPLLQNQTLNVCVRLEPDSEDEPEERFAVIPFSRAANRFVTLPSEGGYDYILLEDVVASHIERFFPGELVLEVIPFRITRNADLQLREDAASDLLSSMEKVLEGRKLSATVRLEISAKASPTVLAFLEKALEVTSTDRIYALPGPIDLAALWQLVGVHGYDHLRTENWPPQKSPEIDPQQSMFETLSEKELVLYHPYEGFEPIVRLVEEAADDPDVIAIKQILYRTSRDSPIVNALMRAAERGKSVSVIVELKARFDEARNIEWARTMERAGVQVIYGVRELKTHAKLCIVIRREPHGIQRYCHFGTGNYNESTAKLYSDVSFMTSDDELASDAVGFFNAITGYSQPQTFRKIEMSPIGLRDKVLEMIRAETERKKQGQPAEIIAKLNSLVDPQIIDALYEASEAGVKVKLNLRGVCCLRPGASYSKNITVISVIDRFLEHARLMYFYNGGNKRVYISSADWMPRNLDRRVELLTPIESPALRDRLIAILELYFEDTLKAHKLKSDGSYERLKPTKRRKPLRSQEVLYQQACEAIRLASQAQRTRFRPHQAEALA